MYPLLRALEQRGLVASYWEHPERRSRRFYAITPSGEGERERLRGEVGPRLEAVAESVQRLRAVLAVGAIGMSDAGDAEARACTARAHRSESRACTSPGPRRGGTTGRAGRRSSTA